MRNEKIVIFGDSYSTFEGYIPHGYAAYYPQPELLKVSNVSHTWWRMLENETGSTVILNDSWSGSTICNTGYEGDCSQTSSFIHRLELLTENGFFKENELDRVLVFGGTNDSWTGNRCGDLKFSDWTAEDKAEILPGMCCFFDKLITVVPKEKIHVIINSELREDVTDGMVDICCIYDLNYTMLENIEKIDEHPTYNGMVAIKEQVVKSIDGYSVERSLENFEKQLPAYLDGKNKPVKEVIAEAYKFTRNYFKLPINICYDMPEGFETANGMFRAPEMKIYVNKELFGNRENYEILFYFFHELRHTLQFYFEEMFPEIMGISNRFFVQYDGTCYTLVDGEYIAEKLEGEEAYFTDLYLASPCEKDANDFAYRVLAQSDYKGEKLEKLYKFWRPKYTYFTEQQSDSEFLKIAEKVENIIDEKYTE